MAHRKAKNKKYFKFFRQNELFCPRDTKEKIISLFLQFEPLTIEMIKPSSKPELLSNLYRLRLRKIKKFHE